MKQTKPPYSWHCTVVLWQMKGVEQASSKVFSLWGKTPPFHLPAT